MSANKGLWKKNTHTGDELEKVGTSIEAKLLIFILCRSFIWHVLLCNMIAYGFIELFSVMKKWHWTFCEILWATRIMNRKQFELKTISFCCWCNYFVIFALHFNFFVSSISACLISYRKFPLLIAIVCVQMTIFTILTWMRSDNWCFMFKPIYSNVAFARLSFCFICSICVSLDIKYFKLRKNEV